MAVATAAPAASAYRDPEVARLRAWATARPREYERRVLLFALLGYGYLLLALLVLVGLVFGLAAFIIWRKSRDEFAPVFGPLFIGLATLFVAIIRSFSFTPPPPEGIRLRPADFPELFRLVEDVRSALRASPIHEVLLGDDVNAAVVQRPLHGPLGGVQRYLVIGLPLLMATTPGELHAILAHEIGHIAATDGKVSAWIYGVRETWMRLLTQLDARRAITAGLFQRIFGWYISWFARYSFALTWRHERAADLAAANLAGPAVGGDALVRAAVFGHVLMRHIGAAFAAAELGRDAPCATSRRLLDAGLTERELQRALRAALSPDEEETVHGSLAERLAALGMEPHLPSAPSRTAAQYFLGPELGELCERVDAAWRAKAESTWSAVRPQIAKEVEELRRLDARAAELSVDDLRRRAELTRWLRGNRFALPLFEDIGARHDDARAHLAVGEILLADGDDRGLSSVDRALARDPSLAVQASSLARAYLESEGRAAEATRYEQIYEQNIGLFASEVAARSSLSAQDELTSHDLPERMVGDLVELLSRVKPIARAFLVRKVVPDLPEARVHVLGILFRTGWFLSTEDHEIQTLQGRIADGVAEVSPDITVVMVNKYLGRKQIESVAGSLLYAAPPRLFGRDILPGWGATAQRIVTYLGILYFAYYVYLVTNLPPQYNSAAGLLVLVPLASIVVGLIWARREDDDMRRTVGIAAVVGFIGTILGAFVMEQEWTYVLIPVIALGLFRPPRGLPARTAFVTAAALSAGIALRVIAHVALVG
jgi:Zn-dependent protease with chaperone function